MQTSADALDIVNGEIIRAGAPGPSMPLAELARSLPDSLSAEDTFESAHMVYPYGVHVAVARVDGDTGAVHIEHYLIAYDIGKAVNPKLVEGQIAGGMAQGIGGALLEEFRYDENGEPLSVTFADYLMPTVREVPELTIIVSEDAPSPLNPLGLKGAGEGGTAGPADTPLQDKRAFSRRSVRQQSCCIRRKFFREELYVRNAYLTACARGPVGRRSSDGVYGCACPESPVLVRLRSAEG